VPVDLNRAPAAGHGQGGHGAHGMGG
jgi:hypothetical protein